MTGGRMNQDLTKFDDTAARLEKFVAEFIAEHGRWPKYPEVLREKMPGLRSMSEVVMMMKYVRATATIEDVSPPLRDTEYL